jgi:hypothetical protein
VANVYALRYFGDGGLLSNITSFVQPVSNLVVSNAVTTTNLVANTMTLANATASITGNIYVSNALSTTNAYLTGALNVQGVSNLWNANVANVYALRYFGDGGLLSNITSFVQPVANLVVSNAVTTTNLVANTLTLSNASASITGNLYVSNALSTTNAYLTGALNVQGVSNLWNANVANVYALRYFGDGGLLSNITSFVQPVANLVVSNTVTTTNLVANTMTLANATASITGNLYVSNALSTTNAYLTGALNVQGVSNLWVANVGNVYALRYFGDGGLLSNITSFVQPVSNLVVSNAVTTTNLVANTMTLSNATASITGNLYVSNALSTTNLYLTGNLNVQSFANIFTANVGNVYALRYFGDGGLLSNITSFTQPLANLVVSNTVTTTNLVANTMTLANATARITGNLYVSNAVTTTNLFANTMALANASASITGNLYVSNAVTTTNLYTAGITSNSTNTTFSYDTLTVPYMYATTMNVTTTANIANIFTTNIVGFIGSQWTSGTGNVYYLGNVGIGTSTVSANLTVLGNIYASNALQTTNLIANTLTLANATASITGNLYVSNALQTTNLIANTLTLANATASITGNLYVSNALQTTNLFANTLTLANATASITGNLYVSNALQTTNVLATTINASTINVASISVPGSTPTPGYVLSTTGAGLSWIAAGGGGSSQWTTGTGNIYYTSSVGIGTSAVSAQLTVAGNIYYTDDIFKRGPYLVPSAANANAIQSWISSTCNNSSTTGGSSWWSRSAVPTYSNLVTKGTSGSFIGSVSLNDGRILFVPYASSNIGVFNPATNQYSLITPTGSPTNTGTDFVGGVLVPNGNVVFVPYTNSNIGMYNPATLVFSNIVRHGVPSPAFYGGCLDPNGNVCLIPASTTSNIGTFNPTTLLYSNVTRLAATFAGGVLLPNGNIICIPATNANIVQFNPYTSVASNSVPFGINGAALDRWRGGVLAPNGNVIFIPGGSAAGINSNVGVFNPTAGTFSNVITGGPASSFFGGCLLPTGNVVMAPYNSANVGMFDTYTLGYSNSSRVSAPSITQYTGCSVIPDGRVVFAPFSSGNVGVLNTITPAPVEFCLAPYFNKV